MKIQLTIGRQGLLLVAIPLIFEIAFVATLWTMLKQADSQRKDITRSREFVAEVITLTKDYLDAGICLAVWKATKTEEFAHQFDSIIGALPSDYEKLASLAEGDPVRQRRVAELKSSGQQIADLISSFRRPSGAAILILMDPMSFRQKLVRSYTNFMSVTSAAANEEKEKQMLSPAREERTQTVLSIALLIGIILNIVISFLMVRFFSSRVTKRLEVLTDNYRRFAHRERLNDVVEGNDEIADLDGKLHEMVAAIRRSESKRDEYVQMVNHDLRAPLASTQTVLANAINGVYGDVSEQAKLRISDAKEDLMHLLDLINETMEVDRLESRQFVLDKEQFDLSDLITSTIASMRPLAGEKSVTLDFHPTQVLITGDSKRLKRVITNLIDNAIKYSPPSSAISMRIQKLISGVTVELQDSGPGVPLAEADRIFQPYERVTNPQDPDKPGKGLGLAICKAIVEAHGGRIGVKAGAGRGSVFWFTLPSG